MLYSMAKMRAAGTFATMATTTMAIPVGTANRAHRMARRSPLGFVPQHAVRNLSCGTLGNNSGLFRRGIIASNASNNDNSNGRINVHERGGILMTGTAAAAATAKTSQQSRMAHSKVSALSLTSKKRKGNKITMITAYDYPSAIHVARAGVDMVLVGDSVAMVELGHETTQQMSMETMLHHCQSVKRGLEVTKSGSMLIGDMPFGTYEFNDRDIALRNAFQFIKEASCDAVKIEGGSKDRALTAKTIVEGGVAVMGHIGLTPQAISVIGGFRAQGRTAIRARELVDEALRLQDAGCFAIVIECVPDNVAKAITESLEIPTIGIGAGGHTSGQVLVFHDMLGMLSHPHHEQFVPKFCKKYAQVGHIIQEGLTEFIADVKSGEFPGEQYAPYSMNETEQAMFQQLLRNDAAKRQRDHQKASERLKQTDEYETLHLYGKKS